MELKFDKRTLFKKKTKKLRDDGIVPVVCYGGGKENKLYIKSIGRRVFKINRV